MRGTGCSGPGKRSEERRVGNAGGTARERTEHNENPPRRAYTAAGDATRQRNRMRWAPACLSALKHAGAQRIRFLCLVAAPEGVRHMLEHHSDVPIFAAALDRELNEDGYILPGLGDAGDRLFGTR